MASLGKSSLFGDVMPRAMEKIQKLAKRRSAPTTMSVSNATSVSQEKSEPLKDPSLGCFQQLCAQFPKDCIKCKAPLTLCLDARFDAWRSASQVIPPQSQLSSMRCSAASDHPVICGGCGKVPSFAGDNTFTSLGVVNHCCDLGRLNAILFLLSRFDAAQAQNQKPDASQEFGIKDAGRKSVKLAKAMNTPGVGYAAGFNEYLDEMELYDYVALNGGAAAGPWGGRLPVPLESEHEQKKQAQDRMVIETVKLLTACLPVNKAKVNEELSMFRISTLFDKITELIRNDSITDITERSELFMEVITFIDAVASRPGLCDVLFSERPIRSSHPGIHFPDGFDNESFGFFDHQATSLGKSFFNASNDTYRQAKTFLRLDERLKGKFDILDELPTEKQTRAVCRALVDMYAALETKLEGAIPGAPSSSQSAEEAWNKFRSENQVTFTDDVLTAHRYQREIATLSSSTKKGRLNAISKEIATLTTSLPSGIFLKIAETRSDVMKVLFVGSAGSPYAGGLFIFDIFLDAEYPATPPKMAFTLNGNDNEAFSFNPNLHRGGTVCLSLLNTWSGGATERWQPNKSTILAVLISVQAMILGAPIPWINEPGYEAQATTKPATDHRLLIQSKTLKYAMISWLENEFKNPILPEAPWKDISQTYWKYNGLEVLKTVREWSKENPAITNFDPLNPTGKKIKKKAKKAAAMAEPGSAQPSQAVNLLQKMENLLGIKTETVEPSKIGGLMSRIKGKRKASDAVDIPVHLKKQKSATPSVANRWVYTGGKTQKEVRAVCKEFGIGSKPTIANTVTKIEDHVNNKGKASATLVAKWGKFSDVSDADMATSSSGVSMSPQVYAGLPPSSTMPQDASGW